METIPSLLAAKVRAALGDDTIPVTVSAATDTRFGDYQTNVAMQLAKVRKANPRALAEEIAGKMEMGDMGSKAEIAGAGFINFRLNPEWLAARLQSLSSDPKLGCPQIASRSLVIDFSSPNVAKSMHVGHIRSTVLGDSLARIGRFLGYKVVTDNHIGDWGTQFGMLLVGWKTLLDKAALDCEPIAELERTYKAVNAQCDSTKPQYNAEIHAQARQELVKLQSGDAENIAIWKEMIRLSQVQFDEVYSRLGITFDHTYGESHYNPWLKEVVSDLVAKGVAKESQGALCVFSDQTLPQKEDPFLIQRDGEWVDVPAMVQKADGAANYTTTDLATLQFRLREFAPDEIIYVTDGRQQHHFRQFFAIFNRWQPEAAAKVRLSHVWFGSILGEDNKPFKTRSGDTVKLAELLDEAVERAEKVISEKNPTLPENERKDIARIIGLGAIKYADLLPNRQGDYVFSWDRMLSFQGNTAPYLQNAYVRIQSIFRKATERGVSTSEAGEIKLTEPAELALARTLNQFGEILPAVMEDHKPNLLANYLFELASAFHSFFEACPVLIAEESQRPTRFMLCRTTANVLRKGLELLGIGVPERM